MIEVRDVRKFYGPVEALKGLSFTVGKGEIVGLLGPNGAGKTTMMKILTGYLEPHSGEVRVGGFDVVADRLRVQGLIGYLPENAPLYLDMTVQDYLLHMGFLRGVTEPKMKKALGRAVERTGLMDRLMKPIGTLSKGYRQRVGLAQAILHSPDLLILDEPTNGLDPTQIVEIRSLIQDLAKESTVILSSHILSEVQVTCRRALIIAEGTLRHDGPLAGSQSLRLEIDAAHGDVLKDLQKGLSGVAVTGLGSQGRGQAYRLVASGNAPLAPRLSRLCREKAWDIHELRPEGSDLERLFRELVTS
ncbi:MAG: ABC transporter ATP-binding protein [Planctomycetota bacterium]